MSTSEILRIISDPVVFEEMTQELFSKVDKDKSLTLDKYELRIILIEFAEIIDIKKPTEDDIEDILMGFDSDGNCSNLSYEEFKTLLKRLIRQIVTIIS
jgi:Ca2+-binding EF-hand superfamily protein